jgi:hypothetical protein
VLLCGQLVLVQILPSRLEIAIYPFRQHDE